MALIPSFDGRDVVEDRFETMERDEAQLRQADIAMAGGQSGSHRVLLWWARGASNDKIAV